MDCCWGMTDCKNEDIKCHLCTVEKYHYEPIFKQKKETPKAKITKRQGSLFEAKNHINNCNMLNDTVTRMTPNSGAGEVKGDEEISGIINIMEELKTHHTKNKGRLPGKETFTIQKAWLDKLHKEAIDAHKEFWYLKFAFKNEDDNHYVIVESDTIMSMVKTMIHDRRKANGAQYKIDIANKNAMFKDAESAKLFAENELLKAKIKDLEYELSMQGENNV